MASSAFWGIKGIDHQLRGLRTQLDRFDDAVRKRIVKRATKAALKVIVDGIRGKVPPRFKEVKRLIGERLVSLSGQSDIVTGIVGAGVGAASRLTDQSRTHSGGVGISGANIHWFILGTGQRTRKSGGSTGAMPPQVPNVVKDGFEASKTAAMRVFLSELQAGIETEREKVYAAIKRVSV